MQLDPEDLYDRLREEGLLAEDDGDALTVTDAFSRNRAAAGERVEGMDDEAVAALAAEYADEEAVPSEALTSDPTLLSDAVGVFETCETLDRPTSVLVARSIRRSEQTAEESIPEGFLSLSAEEIDPFLNRHDAAILYFWRDDCDPCEAAKADLETALERTDVPESVGFAAVYGPDHVDVLREEYDVAGAPTMLFCIGDRIESRFVGNPGLEAIETELSVLICDADA